MIQLTSLNEFGLHSGVINMSDHIVTREGVRVMKGRTLQVAAGSYE